jgi:hypothetical protein
MIRNVKRKECSLHPVSVTVSNLDHNQLSSNGKNNEKL